MNLALGTAPRAEFLRWTLSFSVVIALHAGLTLVVLSWASQSEPPGAPPAAMMIDLAPLPAAPPLTPTEQPPAPEPTEAAPPPEPPPPPPPEPDPVQEPVAKPEPPPPPDPPQEQQVAKPEEEARPPTTESAAPQAAPELATKAAAPLPGASALPPTNAVPNWQGMLLGHLEQHKRYPRDAQWRRQEGVVYLHFTMDREGKVLDYRLEKSSGFDSLDTEVLALIERAQPLPPPPDELSGDPLELVVPVQFYMR